VIYAAVVRRSLHKMNNKFSHRKQHSSCCCFILMSWQEEQNHHTCCVKRGCATMDLPCSCCTINSHPASTTVLFLLLYHIVWLAGIDSIFMCVPVLDAPRIYQATQFLLLYYIVWLTGVASSCRRCT
jgi:hypothetical protein